MKVSTTKDGIIQCLSDTCTEYCPKFNECIDIPQTTGTLIRELAIEPCKKIQNGGD